MRKFESCLTCNEISFKAAWLKKEPHLAECDFKSEELFQSYIVSVFLTGKIQGSSYDRQLHHICLTWRNSDGALQFYRDGALSTHLSCLNGLKKGYEIRAGFSLVLEREQDSLGGGYRGSQFLLSHLKNLNERSYVFHTRTIRRVSTSCLAGVGNFFQWNNDIYGVKGKTAVVMPSPCDPQKWFHCETTELLVDVSENESNAKNTGE